MNEYMFPIHGLSKGKRLKWEDRQNHISWAYMKEMREHNDTRKVYDINPYIEVYRLDENLYGLFNQNCDGMGDVWEYLIIGPEKAMLIDTAFGIGDIKGLCDEITGGMELIVANTHIGVDHALGNVQFEKVYCYEKEYENIKRRLTPEAWDYLFDKNGDCIWMEFDKRDLPAFKEYELIAVENHHIFNLGEDYEVELVWMPGHAAGHSVFLDRKKRRLYAGDCLCSDVISMGSGTYRTIEDYRNELKKLCERLDEFDFIYPGHFMVALESTLMLDILDTLEKIMEDPEDYNYCKEIINRRGERQKNYYKYVPGFTVIKYDIENGVYARKEEK